MIFATLLTVLAAAPAAPMTSPETAPAVAVGNLRFFKVPAALGPAVAVDGKRLVAAVEGAAELLVVSLETGAVSGRITLPEAAEDLALQSGRLFVAGRRSLTVLDAGSLAVVPAPELPLTDLRGLAAPADTTLGTVAVVGTLRGASRPGSGVVVLDARTLKPRGEPFELPAGVADDLNAKFAVSGDARRLYASRSNRTDVFSLADGRALPADGADHGRVVGDRTGRFAFGSDGQVLTADGLKPVARLAGGFVVPHPTLPLAVSFSIDQSPGRPVLDDLLRFGTLHVHRLPDFAKAGEWTAPGTLTGRRPILLPDGRVVFTARSIQATGSAAGLTGGSPSAAAALAQLAPVADLLKGAFSALVPGPKSPPPAAGTGSVKINEITDKFTAKSAPVGGPPPKLDDKPAAPSAAAPTGGRETYVIVASVGFDRLVGPPRVMFERPPPAVARPGQLWSAVPAVRRIGGGTGTSPEFAKLAGPPGLTVDPANGEMRFTPAPADLGRHAVSIRARSGTAEDRLTFDLEVRLPETALRLADGRSAAVELPVIAADGAVLVAADADRRTLRAFGLIDPSSGEPASVARELTAAPTSRRIEALARHGALVAVAEEGEAAVALRDPQTLAVTSRLPTGTVVPRHLLSAGGRLIASGTDSSGRGLRTVVLDTDSGRTVGEPIPAGGPMTLLPDGRTLVFPGSTTSETVMWDLAGQRLIASVAPGRTMPADLSAAAGGAAVIRAMIDSPAPGRGGVALHPRLPVAVLWGEAADRPNESAPANGTGHMTAVRISGRHPNDAAAERARPLPLSLVTAGAGRLIRRMELPPIGPVVDIAFSPDGGELFVIAADRVQRLSLSPDAWAPDGKLVFVSEPPATVEAGAEWRYKPIVLPESAGAKVAVAAAPPAVRYDPAAGEVAWRPDAADIGRHTVRISARSEDGRTAEQVIAVQVRPASVALAARPIGAVGDAWYSDADGEFLIRKAEQKVEIHPASGGKPAVVDFGERLGAAAMRGRRLVVVLPVAGRVAVVDPGSARVVNRATLDAGRPVRPIIAGADGDILIVTDTGAIRRLEPEFLADTGVVAYGSVAALSAEGDRLYTVARSEALPAAMQAELAIAAPGEEGLTTVRPPDRSPAAIAAAAAAERRYGPSRKEPKPAPCYLLTYARTPTALTLLDAAPMPTVPDALLVSPDGTGLVTLFEGVLTVRPAANASAVPVPIPVGDEKVADISAHPYSGRLLATTRSGRPFWIAEGPAGLRAEAADLRGLDELTGGTAFRAALPAQAGFVWLVAADRAYRLPTPAPVAVSGTEDDLRFRGLPPLLYRPGCTWRYAPILTGDADLRLQLKSGPAGMTLDEAGRELTWTPDRAAGDLVRVVIAAKDRSGHTAGQAFLLRRERR